MVPCTAGWGFVNVWLLDVVYPQPHGRHSQCLSDLKPQWLIGDLSTQRDGVRSGDTKGGQHLHVIKDPQPQ